MFVLVKGFFAGDSYMGTAPVHVVIISKIHRFRKNHNLSTKSRKKHYVYRGYAPKSEILTGHMKAHVSIGLQS
jgi:hypothetical protein